MKSKKKTAISLIVLVITILVLSILAATVIISLSNTNVIEETSKTAFKHDMSSYKEAYELYVAKEMAENEDYTYDRSNDNYEYPTHEVVLNEIFGNVPDKYKEGLKIQAGKLVYETENESEKEIVEGLGMTATKEPIIKEYVGEVPIPSGFYYVYGDKDSGLVISDNQADENANPEADAATLVGNQFVWVPVNYTKTGTTTSHTIYKGTSKEKIVTLYDNFTTVFKTGALEEQEDDTYKMTGKMSEQFMEPYETGYPDEVSEYYEMMESVQEYGGFYIARYEAGDEEATISNTARDDLTAEHTVIIKKGAQVYNYVPWGLDNATISPSAGTYQKDGTEVTTEIEIAGAVYLSKKMYENSNSVKSTLCYGVQWDSTLNFVSDQFNISDSTEWGNFSDNYAEGAGSLQTTGFSEAWKAKNIYDLAGNVREWTMELKANGHPFRVPRGSGYFTKGGYGVWTRDNWYDGVSNDADVRYGFRPTLYIVVE